MVFNSFDFLIFFPIAVLIYYLVPHKVRYIWLLICSYYFYMSWNPIYATLILTSTIITYAGGLIISRFEESKKKRLWCLIICIVLNLCILFYFKYTNFFVKYLFVILRKLHLTVKYPSFDIILPVGISFYTFQALGYLIDVYRKNLPAEKNPLIYALYVSFFPQLVAGPIERSKTLLSQLNLTTKKRPVSFKLMYHGFINMVWGMFLKLVIADRILVFVQNIFDNYFLYGTFVLLFGVIAFAIQIYCDFLSYSTIAVGAAQVLGINLMENFNTPYLASSIKDFWRRWHISLSTWFRDYLYIPLGGNRCSKPRHYLNILITFLVSGLWHGASFNFIIWGGIHGLYQIIEDLFTPVRNELIALSHLKEDSFSFKLWRIVKTFFLTCIAWVFFRADGLKAACLYIKRMFTVYDPWVLFNNQLYMFGLDELEMRILIFSILLLLIVDLIKYKKNMNIATALTKQNYPFQFMVLLFLIVFTIVFGAYGVGFDSQAFIYFQF